MKVLFVCNQNQNRSKTAENLFKTRFQAKSAGLYNENSISESEISWADVVVVMEKAQREEIAKRFPKQYMQKQILSLDIPDIYHFNQPKLIGLLQKKMENLL